jgi:hypothetical protein
VDGHIIKGDDHLESYITQYYKRLFGPPEGETFSLDGNRRDDTPQIAAEDNEKN